MSRFLAKYLSFLVLLGASLPGCQSSFSPSPTPDVGYELTCMDSISHGVIHLLNVESGKGEWEAWLDWQEGKSNIRSTFHTDITYDKQGNISEAFITRYPNETLHLTLFSDRLHCELSQSPKPTQSFDIATQGARLFIPPDRFPTSTDDILCFDPFTWDYVLIKATPKDKNTIILTRENALVGFIKTANNQVISWELPLLSIAKGSRIEFSSEKVSMPAITTPILNSADLTRISTLSVDFNLSISEGSSWHWVENRDFLYEGNECHGQWDISTKATMIKKAEKAYSITEGDWDLHPASLPTLSKITRPAPKPATIPSTPLSALLRGEGDDRSRAWLAATLAHKQGWRARIAGGIVLRPGRDYAPVFTTWSEILKNDSIEILDPDTAGGFFLRLWSSSEPVRGFKGKLSLKNVQSAIPTSWYIVPTAANNETWQWELSREGSLLGRMEFHWMLNLTSSRPTIALSYQGDNMNLPLSGSIALEVDSKGHVWSFNNPENSQWMLLALLKGWMLCPTGTGTIAGLSLYFASRDESEWLPPLLWSDGKPAEVREAGEGTYSDGKEVRGIKRYRIDPPGLLASVAVGGELMEVKGDFGTWHRVNLPIKQVIESILSIR